MTDTTHPEATGTRLPLLWFAFLGPPIIWAARFGISYSLVPWVCARNGGLLLQAITVVALIGTGAAGVVGWRQWHAAGQRQDRGGGDDGGGDEGDAERARFMAAVGILGSALFALVIAAEALPIFLIDPCQSGGVSL